MKQLYVVNYIGYTDSDRVFGRIEVIVYSKERVVADKQIEDRVKKYLAGEFERVEVTGVILKEFYLVINL